MLLHLASCTLSCIVACPSSANVGFTYGGEALLHDRGLMTGCGAYIVWLKGGWRGTEVFIEFGLVNELHGFKNSVHSLASSLAPAMLTMYCMRLDCGVGETWPDRG